MSNVTQTGAIAVTEGPLSGEVTFEWSIKKIFSLSDETDREYKSPLFGFSDMCFYMSLYPNGESHHESSGWLGLYICREDSGPTKTFLYRYGIKSPDGLKYELKGEMELEPKAGRGTSKFCSRSALKDQSSTLIPRNVLTIKTVLKSIVPSVPKGLDKLLKSIGNLMNSTETADFTIKVQDKEYPVHRAILGARSDVFKSMFTLDMIEKNKGVVTIADCDPEVFRDFLEYVYTGSIDISAKDVVGLYTVSDKYYVSSLKEECTEYMKEKLTVANVCEVMRLSQKHDDKVLLKCATEFFCINAFTITNTDDWETFLTENPKVGNKLFIKALSKSYQGTSSEILLPPLKKQKTDTS